MRLTERVIDDNGVEHIFTKYVKDNGKLKDKKLCDLEDIEEELGIDLLTLFKALKNGVWNNKGKEIKQFIPNDDYHIVLDCNGSTEKINYWTLVITDVNTNEYIDDFWVKDYGKTWALTKEELE